MLVPDCEVQAMFHACAMPVFRGLCPQQADPGFLQLLSMPIPYSRFGCNASPTWSLNQKVPRHHLACQCMSLRCICAAPTW
eukprot:14885-Karenia_brevis.AAC.1